MGQMKNLYLDQLDAEANGAMDGMTIYVLTCNGKPCNAYMDKAEADYEAWLCNQVAVLEPEGNAVPVYVVTETILIVM
jgi:hypothetical protein